MTYLEGADYYIYLTPFPPKVHSAVVPNSDGTYSMYLDSRKTKEEQIPDYIHELEHIVNGDFDNEKSIVEIEEL